MSKRIFKTTASFDHKNGGTKAKFNVLNRSTPSNITDKAKKDAKAKKTKAVKERLQEQDKSNKFVDGRIGEKNDKLTEEEKINLRFQAERKNQIKRANRKNKFALGDDEDELTHMGQSLAALSREELEATEYFENDSSDDDDEKDGRLSAETTRFANFGGSYFEGERAQATGVSKDDLASMSVDERQRFLIRSSKMAKAEKQEQQNEQDVFADDIDSEFNSLTNFLERRDVDADEEDDYGAIGIDGQLKTFEDVDGFSMGKNIKSDDYMTQLNKLSESAKAIASNRLLTDEEIAEAKKEQLLMLAKAAERRKNATDFDSDSDNDVDSITGYKFRPNYDDDSEDDFNDPLLDFDYDSGDHKGRFTKRKEAKMALKRSLALKSQDQDDEDDEDDEDGEEGHEMVADMEYDEDDEDDEDDYDEDAPKKSYGAEDVDGNLALDDDLYAGSDVDSDDLMSDVEEPQLSGGLAAEKEKKKKRVKNVINENAFVLDEGDENPVPFTFEAPIKFEEFQKIISSRGHDSVRSVADHELIVTRIRALYDPKLNKENYHKMECLYKHLYRHFRLVCEEESTRMQNIESKRPKSKKALKGDIDFKTSDLAISKLDFVTRQLFEMNDMLGRFSGKANRQYVHSLRTSMQERLAGISADNVSAGSYTSYYPLPHEILGMKLVSKLYPTSDYRHTITTPLLMELAEVISTFPVRGGRDITVGLFIVSILLEFVNESKRLIPEIIQFLHSCIVSIFDLSPSSVPSKYTYGASEVMPRDKEDYAYLLSNRTKTFASTATGITKLYDLSSKPTAFKYIERINKMDTTKYAPGFNGNDDNIPKNDSSISSVDKLPIGLIFLPHNDFPVFETVAFQTAVLNTISKLTFAAAQTYSKLETFPEIFSPLYAAIDCALTKQTVTTSEIPESFSSIPADAPMATKFRALLYQIHLQSNRISALRQPLAKYAKPVAIREFEPVIQDYYLTGKKDLLTDREETKRLEGKLKRDKKTTMRQVKKDNQLLLQEKTRIINQQIERKQNERKRVRTMLAQEINVSNIMDQVSKKKRTI